MRIPLVVSCVTSGSGSVATWYARHLHMRGSIRASQSGTLAGEVLAAAGAVCPT